MRNEYHREEAASSQFVSEVLGWQWPQSMENVVFALPPHTCYIDLGIQKEAFERGLYRLFTKEASSIEVFNEGGALSRLFRAVRDCPQELITATEMPELATMKSLLTVWFASLGQKAVFPHTVEALHHMLFAPYRRLRTVSFESLDWRTCFKRYDRPGALQLIDLDLCGWEQQDELLRLLRASLCCWMLEIPREMEWRFAEIADLPRVSRCEGLEGVLWLIAASPLQPS